ncbi:hypothetical protein EVAR_97990_1 [Eumeta japonica]|uniref:Uncharacterized protein n=1 Tax=Eumeta variegata TaxID=151549 RepID=A0A4C1WI94_EUMVA|nr:hypothetical protein EVAR_97990_1 [Eumeta japonica]
MKSKDVEKAVRQFFASKPKERFLLSYSSRIFHPLSFGTTSGQWAKALYFTALEGRNAGSISPLRRVDEARRDV